MGRACVLRCLPAALALLLLQHGGGFERDLAESYDYRNGRFYTGMCVLEVLLADQPAGAGGLCIVPGSRAPTAFRRILRSA